MSKKLIINKGDKFNKLIIIKEVTEAGKNRRFKCKCDCGIIKEIALCHLNNGHTQSCGCFGKSRGKNNKTHGKSGDNIYSRWLNMKARCTNKNNERYKDYGGRGITYDPKWEIFEDFYEDMKEGYKKYLTLDRTDNDGNYKKSNCKWVTMQEQANNKRSVKLIIYNGRTQTLPQWCRELNLSYTKIKQRINVLGWSIEKTFTT